MGYAKNQTSYWIRGTILLVAFCYILCILLLKDIWTESSYVFFAFTLLSLAIIFIHTFTIVDKGTGVVWCTLSSGVVAVYFIVQFVVGGIIGMMINAIGFTTSLIVEIIYTAMYLVIRMVLQGVESSAGKDEHSGESVVLSDREIQAKLNIMLDYMSVNNKDVALMILAELKDSYPMYPSELNEITKQITAALRNIEDYVSLHDEEQIEINLLKLGKLVRERSMRASIYRR